MNRQESRRIKREKEKINTSLSARYVSPKKERKTSTEERKKIQKAITSAIMGEIILNLKGEF